MRHSKSTRARAFALGGGTALLLSLPLGSAALADPLPIGAVVQPDGSVTAEGVVIGSLDATGAFEPLPPPIDQAVEAVEQAVEAAEATVEAAPGAVAEAVSQAPVVNPAPAPPPQPPALPAPEALPAAAVPAAAPATVGTAGQGAAITPVSAAPPMAPADAAPAPAEATTGGGKVAPPLRNTVGPKLQPIGTLSTPFDFLSPLVAEREEAAVAAPVEAPASGLDALPASPMALGSASNALLTLAGGLIAIMLATHAVVRRENLWS